ncbi:unknown [Roseburia sp. CAG:197]|nr:unknown [Roseburia sp. CAG:197]
MPISSCRIRSLICDTTFSTPRPKYASTPSLNSIASNCPVLAPDGTDSRPTLFLPVVSVCAVTSASTVGFPLESKICLACMSIILIVSAIRTAFLFCLLWIESAYLMQKFFDAPFFYIFKAPAHTTFPCY